MKKFHQKSSFAIRAAFVAAAVAVHSAFADTPDEIFDYVQTDGSAYIDTGIIGKAGTKASIGMMWKGISDSTDVCFLGARNGSDGRFLLCHAYKFGWNLGYKANWNNPSSTYTPTLPANDVQYAIMTEITSGGYFNFTVNGKSGGRDTTAQGAYNSGFTMYLFANHGTSSGAVANKCPSGTRCYWTKIWQQDANGVYQLVRDFVPCKKGDRVGLWDRVSGDIFYPVTGTLTAGNTVAIHAEPDKTLEYVEADGRQYIDTGVNARSGTKATAKLIYTESDTSVQDNYGGYVVLGAKGASETSYLHMVRRHYNGNNWRWMTCYGGRYQTLFEDMAKDQTYVLASEITTNGTCKATRNGRNGLERDYSGQTSNGTVVGALDTGVSFYALAANLNGSPGHYAKARLYSMTIEQTGSDGVYQIVRDFTPCMKDGRAGLYDNVSGMIFFGQGFDLIAPPDTDGVPDAFVEYVESDGTQYIDTEVNARSGTKATAKLIYTESNVSVNDNYGGYVVLGAKGSSNTSYLYMIRRHYNGDNWRWMTCYGGRYQTLFEDMAKDQTYVLASEITTNGTCKATRNGRNGLERDYSGQTSNGTVVGALDTGVNFYALAANLNGNPGHYAKVRLYSMTIEQTDENGDYQLVRDFRPCIKDGIAGLYDDISKKIYYPAAGRLRAADKTSPAKFVEYVESDGSLYVDTGIVGKPGIKAKASFAWKEIGGDVCLLGSRKASNSDTRFMPFYSFESRMDLQYGAWVNNYGGTYAAGTRYDAEASIFVGSQTLTVNNGKKVNLTRTNEINTGLNMYIFANDIARVAQNYSKARLYGMKILSCDADGANPLLVRDFKPCVATNGVAALYDKVSGTIFYPHGGLLATGGVERVVAATARWKGGVVTAEADLAVAANWECFDADGNLVADTTPTAVTTVLVGQDSPLLALPAGIAVQDWAGITLTNSVTLSAACDWSPLGLMTLANGVTIDLAGHDLVSGGFTLASGATASVANSGAEATLTFAVADGTAATMNGITFASNIMLAKTGGGKLTTVGSAWSSIVVSNGTLVVSAQSSTIGSVYLAQGTILDLGGKTVTCGTFSGAGKVRNGTLTITGTLSAVVGNPLTFTGVALDVSGAGVAITNPESITGRDPIVIATSDQPITGRARATVFGWKVQVTQDGDDYTLELVPSKGFHLFVR